MKFQIKINSIHTVDEISTYWTSEDYIQLLEKFDYPDAEKAPKETLKELLMMAITDFEPQEAAAIVLEYKLSDHLADGQIQQISNDMLLDKVCEEYPEIGLQSTLFHINQLLFKAFNGKFPDAKASVIDCSIARIDKKPNPVLTNEDILKLFSVGLSDRSLLERLFEQQMKTDIDFPEAENILWEVKASENDKFIITTSEYWLKEEDFELSEFESELHQKEAES